MMKRILISILYILTIIPTCFALEITGWNKNSDKMNEIIKEVVYLGTQQEQLIEIGEIKPEEAEAKTVKVMELVQEVLNICHQFKRDIDSDMLYRDTIGKLPWEYDNTRIIQSKIDVWKSCLNTCQVIGEINAKMWVNAAKYYASKGQTDRAKELYRLVITSYTGNAYRSYVRQAEFGLEDLKEAK